MASVPLLHPRPHVRSYDRPAGRRRTALTVAGAGLLAAACAAPSVAQNATFESRDHEFRVVTVAEGLEHPWGLAFLPDGRKLVTERPGRLRIVEADGGLLPDPVPGAPEVVASGQGGLLDIALHPAFEENGLVYFTYAGRVPEGVTTQVARARFDGERLHDLERIFSADAARSGGRHFGSRLVFDREGYLWISVGDRGEADMAQDPSNHIGTTLRLRDDGSLPDDNPFVGREGYRPEIWSYGHRNAQGMTLHPETGVVWQHEHGPRGGDEINIPEAGLNYGWPVTTHGTAYSGLPVGVGPEAPGMEPPLLHWTPSIAPSGMAFYSGEEFPAWQGDLFVGGLALPQLRRVVMEGDEIVDEEALLEEMRARIRDVRMGPDGRLYLLTDHSDGRLLRLEPAEN